MKKVTFLVMFVAALLLAVPIVFALPSAAEDTSSSFVDFDECSYNSSYYDDYIAAGTYYIDLQSGWTHGVPVGNNAVLVHLGYRATSSAVGKWASVGEDHNVAARAFANNIYASDSALAITNVNGDLRLHLTHGGYIWICIYGYHAVP